MGKMLNLIGAGWESVRSSATIGRQNAALTQATRLLTRPDLPASVASQAHRLAGELLTDVERYSAARRHLHAAAALEPACAQTFYLWGLTHELDPQGCDRRAALCFRRASVLEAGNALYRAAFGRAAVRCGRIRIGVRELLAAAAAAPGDVPVIRCVSEGLIEAGRLESVRHVVVKARFLNPRSRELGALWERVRFEAARKGQHERRGTTRHRQDAEFATDGGRVVLPFVRVADAGKKSVGGGIVRRDVVSLPKPHFPRLRVRKADR
jgi:hypothetical protein